MKYLCYDTAINGEYTLVKLLQKYPKYISVFWGTDDAAIWDAAPYLFEIEDDFFELKKDPFVNLDHYIIFQTKEPKEEVCRFLQYYIYHKQFGPSTYFRIWDARVLLKNLCTWEHEKKQQFFEFFECFYTGSEQEGYLNKWQAGRFYKPVAEMVAIRTILTSWSGVTDGNEIQDNKVQIQDHEEIATIAGEQNFTKETVTPESPKKRRFFIE